MPSSKEHDDDWDFNVMPYVVDQKNSEYWRRDDDLSVLKPNAPEVQNYYLRYLEVDDNGLHRFQALLKKISAAMKLMDNKYSWSVYENLFRQGNKMGRHYCFVSPFGKWAELDEDQDFQAAFEKANGEGTMAGFNREFMEVFSDSYDEIWTRLPELSGGN